MSRAASDEVKQLYRISLVRSPQLQFLFTLADYGLTLPTDDYAALEPSISGKIMELHHSKHHNTYVNSFNAANEQLQDALAREDVATQVALKSAINFHGGRAICQRLFAKH